MRSSLLVQTGNELGGGGRAAPHPQVVPAVLSLRTAHFHGVELGDWDRGISEIIGRGTDAVHVSFGIV